MRLGIKEIVLMFYQENTVHHYTMFLKILSQSGEQKTPRRVEFSSSEADILKYLYD